MARMLRSALSGTVCRLSAVLLVAASLLGLSGAAVHAQATPTPIALDVPAPADCQIAARALPLFPAGAGQQTAATPLPVVALPATPFAAPVGEPADAETTAAVTATLRESIACRNGNEFLRAYALFTQEMMGKLFGGPATIDPEIGAAMEIKDIAPLPRRQRLALASVDDVVLLPDGRVGASVVTANAALVYEDYLQFEQDPGTERWLIDDVEPVAIFARG